MFSPDDSMPKKMWWDIIHSLMWKPTQRKLIEAAKAFYIGNSDCDLTSRIVSSGGDIGAMSDYFFREIPR